MMAASTFLSLFDFSAKKAESRYWRRIDSERVLDVLTHNLDGMLFRCAIDADWTVLFASAGCRPLTGYSVAELEASRTVSLEMLTHPDDRQLVRQSILRAVQDGVPYRVEYRIVCRDGAEKWVLERGRCVVDERGKRVVEAFLEDISERVLGHLRLAEAELRWRSIFEKSVVGMFQSSLEGRYLAVNPALAELYGYEDTEQLVSELSDIANRLYVDPCRRQAFALEIKRKGVVREFVSEVYRRDGERIWISENAHAMLSPDGTILYYEGTVEDVTARKRYEAELEHQATHDPLTGLPNRNLLQDRLVQAICQAKRSGLLALVAFIDLDNFKVINDSLGHGVGDQLLIAVGQRLKNSLREVDTVARYGGDEFVLLLSELSGVDVMPTLERVQECLAEPVLLDGHELRVSASIGVAIYPNDGDDYTTLLSQADAAMYNAKSEGKGQFKFYTPAFNMAAYERLKLEIALRHALEAGELAVHYQPKFDGRGRLSGYEALCRWESATLGKVAPDRFIPLAEETGLIRQISDFVLSTACQTAAELASMGWSGPTMAVNLSARQFADPGMIERIREVLRDTGLSPECLQLELTESMLAADVEQTVQTLRALKALGVRIAIDDFGTGYSSLAYLRRFPIDILKIDRSFVMECDRDSDACAIANAVISLGRSLGLSIVAEGVERLAQRDILHEMGCDEFQGYLFARPMDYTAVVEYLKVHESQAWHKSA